MNRKNVLLGNPNTGKSTLFNALTGAHQHIGNWCGATVDAADGSIKCRKSRLDIVDLPGIYSLDPLTKDEESTINYISQNKIDTIVLVLDATALRRSLPFALDVLKKYGNVIVCVNLADEACRKCIKIDYEKLSKLLDAKVFVTSAAAGRGIAELKKELMCGKTEKSHCCHTADEIYRLAVTDSCDAVNNIDRKIDRIVTGRFTGIPIMICVMLFIFWLTIKGTNYPSVFLHNLFIKAENELYAVTPVFLQGILLQGIFRTLGWIVSVMLPPMAIFFPLFTLLEDLGFLPRMAFNADRLFKAVGVSGKSLLTMCMGFGCNAAGVVSARIIESPRERLIAVLTNSFIPCNGRFAGLLILSSVFLSGSTEGTLFVLTAAIFAAAAVYLAATFFLSKFIKDGGDESFIMELPPYRKPKLSKIIKRSIDEKILYVLGRAIIAAVPAGALLWILSTAQIGGISIIEYIAAFLNPAAQIMGLDGSILAAFIIGMPANEIVLPIIIMCYTGGSALTEISSIAELGGIFAAHGWTAKTAVCTMVMFLNHFPCATTLLTIRRETGSTAAAAAAFALPTAVGIVLCCVINILF